MMHKVRESINHPVFCALLIASILSCTPKLQSTSALGAHFQQHHDYDSLSHLLAHLRLGMSPAEVERLLGKPDYSPIEGQVYYHTSDRRTEEGTPIGLVVDYRRTNPRTGEEIVSGKLESFWLGPIGE